MLGPIESNLVETDMTTFAFGIALGAAVGLLSMTVAGIPISLGTFHRAGPALILAAMVIVTLPLVLVRICLRPQGA